MDGCRQWRAPNDPLTQSTIGEQAEDACIQNSKSIRIKHLEWSKMVRRATFVLSWGSQRMLSLEFKCGFSHLRPRRALLGQSQLRWHIFNGAQEAGFNRELQPVFHDENGLH